MVILQKFRITSILNIYVRSSWSQLQYIFPYYLPLLNIWYYKKYCDRSMCIPEISKICRDPCFIKNKSWKHEWRRNKLSELILSFFWSTLSYFFVSQLILTPNIYYSIGLWGLVPSFGIFLILLFLHIISICQECIKKNDFFINRQQEVVFVRVCVKEREKSYSAICIVHVCPHP